MRRRAVLGALGGLWLAGPLGAAPRRYALDPDASEVGFSFAISGAATRGTMPVASADITVDPENLAASGVDVRLDAAGARTDLPFALPAMKSPGVLDTARFPEIRFRSTKIALGRAGRISEGARIIGELTVRDVTRTVTLDAALYRPRGSAPDDLSRLDIRLSGSISRSAFGATGYADLVADRVDLDIRAEIRQAE